MSLITIYQCLCDETRLRILNLLSEGPLCVCHFQEVLGEPQVKISKHLAYLRARGMVEARRERNWMVYSLPRKLSRHLSSNLACLQDCAHDLKVFRQDSARRIRLHERLGEQAPSCCQKGGARCP